MGKLRRGLRDRISTGRRRRVTVENRSHAGSRRAGHPLARALRRSSIAVGAAWALYLVAAQAFLWTPLLRKVVNAESPTIHLEYRSAWSAWPGRVHATGVRLTSQDRAVQWQLDVERADASIAVWELPRRLFHATRIDAAGVTFALRRRVPKPQLTPGSADGLPPIAGFGPLPIAEEGPDDDLPDWRYRLFSVWLENVTANGVRSIWVDRLRLQGAAQVLGAFYLKPIRRVLIAPAELRGESLVLSDGGSRVAEELRTSLTMSLGPFDPRGATRATIAATLDVSARGAGRLAGVGFLSRATGIPLRGGEGPLTFAIAVRRGQVKPGTSIAVEARNAIAEKGDLLARLRTVAGSFDVPETGPSLLRIEARDGVFGRPGAEGGRVGLARMAFHGQALDLGDPDLGAATIDVRAGRIADAGALVGALGVAGVEGGHGAFALHLAGPRSRLSGWMRGSLAGGVARLDGMAIRADVGLDASVRDFDPFRGGDLSGTRVRVDDGRVVYRGGGEDAAPGWWARIIATHARLRIAPSAQPGREQPTPVEVSRRAAFDADIVAQCRDARPLVGLFVRRSDLPGFVSGLFSMDRLSVRGSAALGDRLVALRDLVADGDGASIRATYLASGGRKQGAALLTVRGLPIGIGVGDGSGGVHLFGPGDWFTEQQARLQAQAGAPAAVRARRAAAARRDGRARGRRPAW